MDVTEEFPRTLVVDPAAEQERMQDLRALNLLDTPPEERFDRITRLAAEFFQVPIAYVAFITDDRQWFKSRVGVCPTETTRDLSFCRHTILSDEPLIMPDAREHPIGRHHPMVVGEPFLRFYAGVPLAGPRGKKIGSFCLLDHQPREFGPDQVARLATFASVVEREMNLGQIIQMQNELLSTRAQLVETQRELDHEFADAARYVRRMLPPPLVGAEKLEWHFEPSAHLGGDGLGYRQIDDDRLAFYLIDVTGHGLGSALLAVTVLEFLRSRQVRETDFSNPGEVIERLNRTFQMKEHAGKFFSAWYGVFSRRARTITYANAGHPPPLCLSENGLVKTAPGGPALGIMPEVRIEAATLPFPPEAELYLFTDGLYEVLNVRGERGSYDEFVDYLTRESHRRRSVWPTILEWAENARKRGKIEDDLSLMFFSSPTPTS